LEIDASLATISNNGAGGLINIGNQINTLSIVGGRNFAPPWFPSTTVQTSGSNSATLTTTIQRTNWFNRTTY
jgi:hypothetical protein